MLPPYLKQIWTNSAVLINMIGQGMLFAFTSSLLLELQEPESTIKVDLTTASWLVSSHGVASLPGFLISSFLMDVVGRRLAHILTVLPALIGYISIYFAQNIHTLMIGRVLGGITAGGTVSLGAIVIGEYSNPSYRGVYLNLKTAAVCFGSLIVHIISHYVTWRTIALLAVIPHAISILIICTWVESPAWLASKGQFAKSEDAFIWLRGNDKASLREIRELINIQKERLSKPMVVKSFKDNLMIVMTKLTKKDFLKPLIIVMVSGCILETSGRHFFPAYALQIIGELTGNKTESFYYTLAIDIIITTSAVCSAILVKFMKRRTLLFSTGFLTVAVCMVNCTYLVLGACDIIDNNRPWIPITMFVVYFVLANLGCTPIPLALLGEIFPLPHRAVGSGLVGIFLAFILMSILQVTPHLLVHIKVYGTFFVFGLILGVSLLILYFILPETKDKTLQEIENYFNYGTYESKEMHKDDEENKTIVT